jgi:sugar O-acyltransferase (sialic acid O-acetyltransferase NeuD family)
MKNIIIVGAGGFGLEVFWLATELGYNILGFLDDSEEKKSFVWRNKKVLGKIDDWKNYPDSYFTIAIGSPRVRKLIYEKMTNRTSKPKFATLIEPSVKIGPNNKIGEGAIICAGTVITAEISLGKQCIINLNSTIGHETSMGDFVTIAPLVAISGCVKINNLVEIGTSAAIKPGLELGEASILGMGGILTKNMPPNSVYVGNPAKFLKNC